MANNSHCRCRPVVAASASPPTGSSEPAMRRWPHPVEPVGVANRQCDPSLRYIRCALSYQNQLLKEIKELLEQLVEAQTTNGEKTT